MLSIHPHLETRRKDPVDFTLPVVLPDETHVKTDGSDRRVECWEMQLVPPLVVLDRM